MAKVSKGKEGDASAAPKAPKGAKSVTHADSGSVNLYSVSGEVTGSVPLPAAFRQTLRPDLIRRDVTASRANRRQPYGPSPTAGIRHAAAQWGKGRGTARVMRMTQGATAVESPNNVGGRRAHPPRVEKVWAKKVNVKERRAARAAALAATSHEQIVRGRGHRFTEGVTVPVVVDDAIEEIVATTEVVKTLQALGLYADVVRAKEGAHERAGRGKMRGRRVRVPSSLLIVIGSHKGLDLAARNLPGVDVIDVAQLNTELLAPGGEQGRLTLFSKSAIQQIGSAEAFQ